jgi:hypothetical protein
MNATKNPMPQNAKTMQTIPIVCSPDWNIFIKTIMKQTKNPIASKNCSPWMTKNIASSPPKVLIFRDRRNIAECHVLDFRILTTASSGYPDFAALERLPI